MLVLKPIYAAALVIGVATLLAAGSTALAHTTVRSQATEGVADDNALKIAHGCQASGLGVAKQSVIFPSASPVVTGSDGTAISGLSAVITQGSLVGLAKPVQDRNVFQAQQLKTDALGNVSGFSATDGALDPQLPGRVPFQFTAPNFVTTSCAKRLLVKIAIADICTGAATTGDGIEVGKVNLWIPDNGSHFSTVGKQLGIDGIGAPATLTINRNVATNPLPAGCGAGIDVTVTPSAADVDANLPIPTVWATAASGGATASVPLVEYYSPALDHYFITWVPAEIAALDSGTGWLRTGKSLRTYTTAQAGTSPVCRYYIPPAQGDSHFFGRGTAECNGTGQNNPSFVLEDPAFMQMFLPAAGTCPANTTPVYRVFSNRTDANHRYMTDKTTRDQMVSLGWVAEGDGPDLVAMCAPQ
jgi:hypothetical protein